MTPANGATGVSTNTPNITATFSEPVLSGTITFVLEDPSLNIVPASLTYNAFTNTSTLTPTAPLAVSTTYTATVSGAQDAAGNAMTSPVSWSFTTGSVAAVVHGTPTTGSDPITGTGKVVSGTTNDGGGTAALDAILAEWISSDSSTNRISKIMNGAGARNVLAFSSSAIMQDTNAYNLSIGGSQTQNNNVFLTLTSLPADKVRKKPGQTDTNL